MNKIGWRNFQDVVDFVAIDYTILAEPVCLGPDDDV